LRWERDSFGFVPHWSHLDLRQFAAFQHGLTLSNKELNYHFYPDDFIDIDELPNKYVVINPSITGPDRTWSLEKWQKLIDILNDNNINVVSIGKKTSQTGFFNELNIRKGVNLCGDERQDSLSQVWHILNKSDALITFDTGIFIFAGSTDTFIIQLGSPGFPIFHAPYRNGSPDYKFEHIGGECELACYSDPKYTLQYLGFFGNKKGNEHFGGGCFMEYPEFKCQPKPEIVAQEVLKLM